MHWIGLFTHTEIVSHSQNEQEEEEEKEEEELLLQERIRRAKLTSDTRNLIEAKAPLFRQAKRRSRRPLDREGRSRGTVSCSVQLKGMLELP